VLSWQGKHAEVVKLCKAALGGPQPACNFSTNFVEMRLAVALSALGDYDAALVHAENAVKGTNDNGEVVMRCRKALILAAADRFPEAIRECDDTLKKFTLAIQVQEIRTTLSKVHSLQGNHAKSEEQLRLVLEMNPENSEASNNLLPDGRPECQ